MAAHLVFGRTSYHEPLAYRGRVEADGPEEVRRAVLEEFGSDWVELTAMPVGAVRWVIGTAP